MRKSILLPLFFLSGLSGLIYQITWVRQASLTFGVSVYAFSTVLTAYMGGLALGSYLLGRRIDRAPRPLQTYARLEVGIAILAVAATFALTGLNGFYAAVARSLQPDLAVLTLLRLGMSLLVLTPPTILIGATLPVMSRIYAARRGQVGGDVGRLYMVNTAGAVLGCLLTALVLIRLLGVREAILVGAGLNLLVAAGAAWLERTGTTVQTTESSPARRPTRTARVQPEPEAGSPWARYVVAGGYALSGFAALGFEVVWARILTIHTYHAVYSFALMLTVFLTGLAVGGGLGSWWLRRRRATLRQFAFLQLGVGLLSLGALYVFARLPSLPIELIFDGASVAQSILYELLLAFITIFPTTLLLGLLFPIVSSLYTRERPETVGLRIGLVGALNTAGAILGSLATGFILIPWLGLRNTAIALSAISLAIGTVVIWLLQERQPGLRWAPPAALSLAVLAVMVMPPGLYLGFREGPSEHLVFYKEGVETTVAVFEVKDQNFKVSFVNGRNEVPTDAVSMRAFRLLGHLPPLLKPDAENALMLSFGNGIASGTMDTHSIPTIEAVDLSREMIEAAGIYWEENNNILRSARLSLVVEDGRNYLLQTDRQYDIITTDATHPANASSWALFTREFYQLVADRLSEDGVFVQWLPFHSLREEDYQAIIRTALDVFPHTTLWYTGGTHTFLVVTPEPLTEATLSDLLRPAASHPYVVEELGLPPQIRSYLLMDTAELATYVGPGRLITDNNAFFFLTSRDTERMMAAFQERN